MTKTSFKQSFSVGVLVAALCSLPLGRLLAQTFKILHNFNSSDGGHTYSGLILSSNTLYGTTGSTVFALNADGTGFRTLHSLNGGTNGDAVFAGLILSGNTLYGTASDGGSGGYGTVFAVKTDGTGFTTLYSFSESDGNMFASWSDLVLCGSTLYGVTPGGGDLGTAGGYGSGTVFAINTDGSDFNNRYYFEGGSDGRGPRGLVLSNNTLFGTTTTGGTFGSSTPLGSGTVFAINTDGTGFTNLYSFTVPSTNSSGVYINNDGFEPLAGLALSGGSFYGVTWLGGSFGSGTIFRLQADGSGFTNLYNFNALPSSGPNTNSGGAQPRAVLSISGRTLCGTTYLGGDFGNGTIFAINTDGTGFTTVYSFKSPDNGAHRTSPLFLSGNTLYGTTYGGEGTTSGYGTVFSLSFEPRLSIVASGPNVILTWPTNYAGFDYTGYTLQSTTNLSSPIWTTNSSPPMVINGVNTVTNPLSGAQQFYRLSL
jgi:uncharacterized repeat protein (TIGR03803 family)